MDDAELLRLMRIGFDNADAIRAAIENQTPPAGCHPQDCCGDPGAHRSEALDDLLD